MDSAGRCRAESILVESNRGDLVIVPTIRYITLSRACVSIRDRPVRDLSQITSVACRDSS